MSNATWLKYVRILAYEFQDFGKLKSHQQHEIQSQLQDCARNCTPAGTLCVGSKTIVGGGLLFFEGHVGTNYDAVGLFRRAMDSYRINVSDVRFALHDGEVFRSGEDFVSTDVVRVAQICEGMPRRPGGLIVLSAELADAISHHRAELQDYLVQINDLKSKEGKIEVWSLRSSSNRLRGLGEANFPPLATEPWPFQYHENDALDFMSPYYQGFFQELDTKLLIGITMRASMRMLPEMLALNFLEDAELRKYFTTCANGISALFALSVSSEYPFYPIQTIDYFRHYSKEIEMADAGLDVPNSAMSAAELLEDRRNNENGYLTSYSLSEADEFSIKRFNSNSLRDAIVSDLNQLFVESTSQEDVQRALSAPLWPNGEPFWFQKSLRHMRSNLLTEDPSWFVWLDWYDERVRGANPNEAREYARVTALSLDDYRVGAEQINRKVMAALEEYESGRSPVSGGVQIDPGTRRIELREEEPQDVPSKPGRSKAEFFSDLRGELSPIMQDIEAETQNNAILDLKPALLRRWNRLQTSDQPRHWIIGIEIIREQIDGRITLDDRRRVPDQISELLDVADSQHLELLAKFPEEARLRNARKAQNQRPLTPDEQATLQSIVRESAEAMSAELQEVLGDLLEDEVPVVNEVDPAVLHDQPLTVEQRDSLYRLKALMLRVKQLVDQPKDVLNRILKVAEDNTEIAERFIKVSKRIKAVWDAISSFLLGG